MLLFIVQITCPLADAIASWKLEFELNFERGLVQEIAGSR